MWHRTAVRHSHAAAGSHGYFALGIVLGVLAVAVIVDAKDVYKYLKFVAMSR